MELQKLKAPMKYQWRVQECKEYGANCVAYIDSRDVQDRLDEVCGMDGWQSDYKEVKGIIYGGIAIKFNDEWIWKWDCGTESNVEKEKGEASDAFKRAAVKWGIGRFLYDLKIVKLKTVKHEKNGKFYPKNEQTGKPIFDGKELTDYINNLTSKPVTAYNHKPIVTNGKPLINNATFRAAMLKIDNNPETAEDAVKALKEKYSLEDGQLSILNQKINSYKILQP